MKNPSMASPAKKLRLPCVIHECCGATKKTPAINSPHKTVPTGPAIETAELQTLLRSAEWLM